MGSQLSLRGQPKRAHTVSSSRRRKITGPRLGTTTATDGRMPRNSQYGADDPGNPSRFC